LILVDILLAARIDSQVMDDNDRIICRQSKVISTKVSVDLPNRFNLLAEYLFDGRLSESFTASALLRNIIEGLLYEYRDGLVAIKSGHIKRVILSSLTAAKHSMFFARTLGLFALEFLVNF